MTSVAADRPKVRAGRTEGPLRVLLLNDYDRPIGGAERLTAALATGLVARGHEVRVFSSSASGPAAGGFADARCFGTEGPLRAALEVANPSAVWRLRRLLASYRPDVVHARLVLTQLSTAILPLLAEWPAIYHATWYRAVCPTGTKRLPSGEQCARRPGRVCLSEGCTPVWKWAPLMAQRALLRRWFGVFDRVVANSAHVRRELVADGLRCDEVIWNGVPTRPARPALEGPPRVLFAGRLVREKGVDVLLEAFARVVRAVPQARLDVAGDGPLRSELEALARARGLERQVEFLGHLDGEALEQRAERAWVQAVPSQWAEPFGLVVAEAMMRGTAVLASDLGGPAEVVDEGRTGRLVAPGDVGAWGDGLVELLTDRQRVERLGAAAREQALARLSLDVFTERCLDAYRGVLER